MSDWWARRLGGRQAQPPASSAAPRNMHQNYPGHQQPPQQEAPPQPPAEMDTSQIRVTTENLFQAAGLWKGGQAHRVDTQPCPQCGSNQFFSRSTGMSRLPPPAPHCYNCGYNGLFEQGDISAWQAAADG